MGKLQDFPLPDGSYSDDTKPWTQQDVVNYLPTLAELPGTRSKHKLATAPGLETFAVVGSGPHRGARDVEGKAFVVSGNKLYQLSLLGTATELGTIPGTGQVSMTHNQIDGGNQLVIGTGDNSYVWDTVTSTLTANGVGLLSVDFLNQLILGVDTQRRFWRYSALADAKTYNDLDNESAESSPDRIVGGIVSAGEWLVFGERTIEPWAHNPTDTAQFQRLTGAISEKGCANANTIKRLDNSVFFLGNDLIVYRMQGYQPVPVSTKAQAAAFRECDPRKAFAFTYEDHGYVIYYLTFQDGQTWGYDVTNQRWHRRESFGLDRWRLNTLFKWNGEWYGGDYQDGKVYRLKWLHVYEGCEIMPRGFTTGVLHSAGNRVFVDAIQLFMDTGRAETPAPSLVTVTGTLPDGMVGDVVDFQYTLTGAVPGADSPVAILAGALPDGLNMTDGGHVTGTITTAGTYSWTLGVANSCGILSESVQVATFGEPIGMTTLTAGDECQAYSQVITVSGGTAPYALGTVTGLPTGGTANLVGTSITIAWPSGVAPGTYTVAFNVTDAGDGLGIFSQSVTVAADNPVLFSNYMTQQAKASNIILAVPAGAEDGDMLIAGVCTVSGDTVTVPGDWTTIKTGTKQLLAYKIRAGDSSVTFPKAAADYRHCGFLLVVKAAYLQTVLSSTPENTTTITKGTATSKVLAFVWDGSRTADTMPPAEFTRDIGTTGDWTKIGHTYYHYTSTDETVPQIQVFLADCPRAAGAQSLSFTDGQGSLDALALVEIEPT